MVVEFERYRLARFRKITDTCKFLEQLACSSAFCIVLLPPHSSARIEYSDAARVWCAPINTRQLVTMSAIVQFMLINAGLVVGFINRLT